MASSPRPDPAPRAPSAMRPWLWLAVAFVAVILAGLFLQGRIGGGEASAPEVSDYAEIVERLDLQADIRHLDADDDWRTLADLPETRSNQSNPFAWLTAARVIFWLIVAVAVAIVVFMIYLAIRHGAGLKIDTRKPADAGARDAVVAGAESAAVSAMPELSLEEIARLADAGQALGALQRLVLQAAAEATGSVLRRSETAREVLRRLPRDWPFYEPVARLVQTAERVRYAGQSIGQDGVAQLVEAVRPILLAREGQS